MINVIGIIKNSNNDKENTIIERKVINYDFNNKELIKIVLIFI